jgi:hypothetical protein
VDCEECAYVPERFEVKLWQWSGLVFVQVGLTDKRWITFYASINRLNSSQLSIDFCQVPQ